MKRIDIFEKLDNWEKLSNLQGIKFCYCLAKNYKTLIKEAESIQESIKPSEEFLELQEKATKDGKYDEKKAEELNKEVYDQRVKQIKEYNEFLKEDVKMELHKIKQEDLPKEITAEQMMIIIDFVE